MSLKKYLAFFLSSTIFHYLFIFLFFNKISFKKKNIFILSSFRWKEDLAILKKNKNFNFVNFEQSRLHLLNSLFQFSNQNKKVNKNFEKFIKFFSKVNRISAFISCSCFYNIEKRLIEKTQKINIPFIAYHKEFTLLNSHLLQTRILKRNLD